MCKNRRLFVGLSFSDENSSILKQNADTFQQFGTSKAVLESNLHCTLAFIGQTCHTEKIKQVLRGIEAESFEMQFLPVSYFQKRNFYILWQGVQESTKLLCLRESIVSSLVEENIVSATSRFVPHITLDRKFRFEDENAKIEKQLETINENISIPKPETIRQFHLYESKQIEGILHYIKIESYTLA